MQKLTSTQIANVSGASIKPSQWVFAIVGGMMVGTTCCILTAFSATPLAFSTALVSGGLTGGSLAAAYDILVDNGL